VAIITGASRGIGKAVALRLASEGAKIVVAAKSEEAKPGLPGTIHETVAEIEAAGGEALAVKVDVRDEAQIEALVAATIERFGKIDIIFNNAGAIFLQGVLGTGAKKFDLMMAVNVRASHLLAHYALPHMIENGWGHILMFSPELHTDPSPGMSAYMISKLGMTRTAISIAEEHRSDNIAANALWPVTMIESQATINHGMGDESQWRTPEIICDAVSELFSRDPQSCTGRSMTDEDNLRETGITNFDHYWVLGKPPEHPVLIAGAHSPIH
jgi:citronellol/citronellal dehydrogenase